MEENLEVQSIIREAKLTIANMEKLLKDNPELKNDVEFMEVGKRMNELLKKEKKINNLKKKKGMER